MRTVLIIGLLCLGKIGQAQSETLLKAWSEAREAFRQKSEEAGRLAIIAQDSKKLDPMVANRVMAHAKRLSYALRDQPAPDSLTILRVIGDNDSLDKSMTSLLNGLEADKDFALLKSFQTFRLLYKTADNRVRMNRHRYNEVASKEHYPHVFRSNEEPPRVEFKQ
jgi:hypothetical protein